MPANQIILASKSPRRKKLLQRIFPAESIITIESGVREIRRKGETVEAFCQRMAEKKSASAWKRCKKRASSVFSVIGADTVVLFRNRIIGQPRDREDAVRILRKLSGHAHEVITGVAVYSPSSASFTTFIVRSKVWMRKLSLIDIVDYVATGEPMDKAGAYAIQGRGRKLIARYRGSYSNIVGLPVDELKKAVKALKK